MSAEARLLTSALLLAAWLGAVLLFVAVVAPAAFAALPNRTLAGALVGRVLPAIFASGIVVGLVVALLALTGGGAGSVGRAAGAAVVAAGCAVSEFWIGGRIAALRAQIGPSLDALAPGDPQRELFGRLHALSVAGLGVAALAAGATLALILLALRARS